MPDALTRTFQQRISLIGDRAGTLTAQHWRDGGHDEVNIEAFTRKVAPVLAAAKMGAVATAAAYYALLAKIRPAGVPVDAVKVDVLYREPFIAYWQALKNGHSLDEAVQSGLARADAFARNFVVSASRRTGDVLYRRSGLTVAYWNRDTDADACPWCVEVADQTYSSAETADFGHDRCGCTPAPVFAS
jgi:hypothetical protein